MAIIHALFPVGLAGWAGGFDFCCVRAGYPVGQRERERVVRWDGMLAPPSILVWLQCSRVQCSAVQMQADVSKCRRRCNVPGWISV